MRISDWISDVCSSDLVQLQFASPLQLIGDATRAQFGPESLAAIRLRCDFDAALPPFNFQPVLPFAFLPPPMHCEFACRCAAGSIFRSVGGDLLDRDRQHFGSLWRPRAVCSPPRTDRKSE